VKKVKTMWKRPLSGLLKRTLFVFVSSVLFSSLIFAADRYSYGDDDENGKSSYSYRRSKSSGGSKFGFGIASNSHLLRTSDTALSGLFLFGGKSAVQVFLVMQNSDPSEYGFAGAFKYTLIGKQKLGFHLGGAVGFGSYSTGGGKNRKDNSFVRFGFLAGLHFTVANRVIIAADSGLTIANDGDDDSQVYIGGHSDLWGVSLIYIF